MPNVMKVQIVPVSEVPPRSPSEYQGIEVNGLTAPALHHGQGSGGPVGAPKQEAAYFEVSGLPRGYRASIRQKDGKYHLLDVSATESEWLGEYSSVQDALNALLNKLS